MRRPRLNEIALESARDGGDYIIVGENEWDAEIENAYNGGHILIEFGATELAVHAYRKMAIDFQPKLFKKEGSDYGSTGGSKDQEGIGVNRWFNLAQAKVEKRDPDFLRETKSRFFEVITA